MTPQSATRPTRPATTDPFRDGQTTPRASVQRAIDYAPPSCGDTLYLKDVEGQEVMIYNITPGEDSFGACCDLLVTTADEQEMLVHVSGYLAGRLIGLRDRVEAGECTYPLAARFCKISIPGGKTVWSMT